MAFAHVQGVAGTSGTGNSISASISAAGAGNLIVVSIQILNTTETCTSVTDDKGNTYVLSAAVDNTTRGYRAYGVQVTGGATTITANFSGTTASKHMHVAEFSGNAASNAAVIDQSNSTTGTSGTSAAASPALTPSASGKLVVGSVVTNGSISGQTAGTNYTLSSNPESKTFQVYRLNATTSETAPASWTTAHEWIEFVDSFNAPTTDPVVNDSVTVSESITMLVDENINLNDSITLTESVQVDSSDEPNVFDSVTITEAVTMGLEDDPSINDSVTVSEAVTMLVDENVNLNDAVTVSESVSLTIINDLVAGEDIAVSESVTVFEANLGIVAGEDVAVSESLTVLIEQLVPAVGEDIAVSEAVTMMMDLNVVAGEDVAVSEDFQMTEIDDEIIAEDIAVSEAVSLDVDINPSVSDAVAVSESVTKTQSALPNLPTRMRSTEQSYPIMMDENETN